jgi:2-methylcitrate dehydratase PrpD
MTIAREIAAFVSRQQYADLPPKAVEHAAMLIASTIASAALGSGIESSKIVRALEVDRGGRADATVWFGAAEKLPVAAAARVSAMMSDAAASDDSDLRSIVHQGTTVCAAAVTMGEKTGASGRDVLAAVVLGYEVTGRLVSALREGFKTKGFHGCILATFAAAVAAARLMQLSESQTAHAIALAATSVGGLMAAANTSCAREYHAGLAAMLGVNAAEAAGKGFVAEEAVLEVRSGFLDTYGVNADVGAPTRDFGTRWSILEDLGIKLMPGGHPFHAVAEAAANAARDNNVAPEDVELIAISRPGFQYANPENPTDLIGIAHSPAYFAAAAVADRDFTWAHASEEKIMDPRIRMLLARVRMAEPPTEHLERYRSGATVTLTTKNGRSYSNTVYMPKGAGARGIAWPDVEEKYRALVPHAMLSDGNVEASLVVVRNLSKVKSISELVGLLR